MRMHVVVTGQVQGVGFRWFVREAARELDLSGWVRNRSDGCVEVAADGETRLLADFRDRLRKGPPHARVESVDDLVADDSELPRPFRISR